MQTATNTPKVVILGTAHGSNVPGKRSPDGKFREYKFSREVIALLRPRLEASGFTVFVDMPSDEVPRPGNTELSLRCRYVNGICKKFGPQNCIYVSIHVNAAGSDGQWHDARGFAVYVARSCSQTSKRLARTLCDLAISRGLRGNRAVPAAHYWQADFYVLRNTACPAVLTENLFQDNRADVEFLSSQAGKEAVATLHLDAIKRRYQITFRQMKKSLMLAATTAMLAVVLLTFASCRSHKEATATTKEEYDVEAAGSITTSTAERFQWLSRFALDIDSFEIVIPTADHVPDYRNVAADTAMDLPGQFALAASRPHSANAVVLRGKHARLGKADIVQRDAARRAEQVDTLSAHRSIDKADHYARDNVGIMKPPDVTWWPWLLLAGLLVGCCMVIWLKDRGR